MTSRDLDVGELDVAVVDPVSPHLLSDVANIDSRKEVEGVGVSLPRGRGAWKSLVSS